MSKEKTKIECCYVEKDAEGKVIVVKRYEPSEKNRKNYSARPKSGR